MSLKGKVAIVTGGNSGIGMAIVLELANQGANIVIDYVAHPEAEQELEAQLHALGERAIGVKADVSQYSELQKLFAAAVNEFGRVDILVNNAGLTRDGLAMRMSEEDWDVVLDTNLKGAFNFMQGVMRPMIKQRSGRIVNISSVAGLMGNAGQANYAASKAGLIGLTKSLARELASRGITVNAVAPGFITTDMTSGLPENLKTAVVQQIPLGRFGEPEDIAAAVAFLAGPEAKYITGQTLTVDGGMVM